MRNLLTVNLMMALLFFLTSCLFSVDVQKEKEKEEDRQRKKFNKVIVPYYHWTSGVRILGLAFLLNFLFLFKGIGVIGSFALSLLSIMCVILFVIFYNSHKSILGYAFTIWIVGTIILVIICFLYHSSHYIIAAILVAIAEAIYFIFLYEYKWVPKVTIFLLLAIILIGIFF